MHLVQQCNSCVTCLMKIGFRHTILIDCTELFCAWKSSGTFCYSYELLKNIIRIVVPSDKLFSGLCFSFFFFILTIISRTHFLLKCRHFAWLWISSDSVGKNGWEHLHWTYFETSTWNKAVWSSTLCFSFSHDDYEAPGSSLLMNDKSFYN